MLGQYWLPYQPLNVVTPAFPEYVSGHSTFSAAGRAVINKFFGTDNFNAKVTIQAGSSKFEKGVPAKAVVLSWKTLDAMADQAGMSRRYGGIHFESGDQQGRALGALDRRQRLDQGADVLRRHRLTARSEPPGSREGPGRSRVRGQASRSSATARSTVATLREAARSGWRPRCSASETPSSSLIRSSTMIASSSGGLR